MISMNMGQKRKGKLRTAKSKAVGRPRHYVWQYYYIDENSSVDSRGDHRVRCRFCVDTKGEIATKSTVGIPSRLVKHLFGCQYTPNSVKESIVLNDMNTSEDTGIHTKEIVGRKRKKKTKDAASVLVHLSAPGSEGKPSGKPIFQRKFESMLLSATLSANLPFEWVDYREVRELLTYLRPLKIPTGNNLSTEVLDRVQKSSGPGRLDSLRQSPHGVTLSITTVNNGHKNMFYAYGLSNMSDSYPHSICEVSVDTLTTELIAEIFKEKIQEINSDGFCISAIVADTASATFGAQIAVIPEPGIIVVPCLEYNASMMAVEILTSTEFSSTVEKCLSLASFFVYNKAAYAEIQGLQSTDHPVVITLPVSSDPISFSTCVSHILGAKSAIQMYCSASETVAGPSAACTASNVPCINDIMDIVHDSNFWSNAGRLDMLLGPLQETKRVLAKNSTIFHVFYQTASMVQQYQVMAPYSENLTRSMRKKLENIWNSFEHPVFFLSYVLNFHLKLKHIQPSNKQFQWIDVGRYAKFYYRLWFEASPSKLLDDIRLYKEGSFPFDADTFGDFTNLKDYYSYISDSRPEISILGQRLFSIVPTTANLRMAFQLCLPLGATDPAISNVEALTMAQVRLLTHVEPTSTLEKEVVIHSIQEIEDSRKWISTIDQWNSIVSKHFSILFHEEWDSPTSSPGHGDSIRDVRCSVLELFDRSLPPFETTSSTIQI